MPAPSSRDDASLRADLSPGSARALRYCSLAAVGLVLFRSLAMLLFGEIHFDSDQAIVGLMAKHLSELQTFPLYFYGQSYMLGVEAWIAAPFFWVGGPTVAMLRLPLVLVNCVVAVWLVRSIAATVGSPWLGLIAALPFVAATPVLAAGLLETLGGSVEPFLYVLALWALRARPLAFGLVLCVGFLHREFTVFAVLAVGAGAAFEMGRPTPGIGRWVSRAAVGGGAVWLVVYALKQWVVPGPPGAAPTAAAPTLQLQWLWSIVTVRPSVVLPNLRQAVRECLPDLLGMRALRPLQHNYINASVMVGSSIIGVAMATVGAICLVRIAALSFARHNTPGARRPSPFCVFMVVVGVQALLAYSIASGVDPRYPAVLRYAFLALFIPIALVTAFFEVERRRDARVVVGLLLVLCAVLNTRDNWRLLDEYRHAPANLHRLLADHLVAHRIRYGSAPYWDAYITSFFSRERVILNSTEKVRIPAYETRVAKNAGVAVRLVRQPCVEGRRVAGWCVVDPLNR